MITKNKLHIFKDAILKNVYIFSCLIFYKVSLQKQIIIKKRNTLINKTNSSLNKILNFIVSKEKLIKLL